MTTLKDAVEAAGRALFEEAARQAKDPARLANGANRARAAIVAFLSHPDVREPSEAMVISTKLRRGAVVPIWQAMLDQLVRELCDV